MVCVPIFEKGLETGPIARGLSTRRVHKARSTKGDVGENAAWRTVQKSFARGGGAGVLMGDKKLDGGRCGDRTKKDFGGVEERQDFGSAGHHEGKKRRNGRALGPGEKIFGQLNGITNDKTSGQLIQGSKG